VGGEVSLLQATVRRLLTAAEPGDLVFMTNREYEFHVRATSSTTSAQRRPGISSSSLLAQHGSGPCPGGALLHR
jgi:mannose-1-phosphate guanylyltransferase